MVSVRCISKCEWCMVNVRCMVEYEEWYVHDKSNAKTKVESMPRTNAKNNVRPMQKQYQNQVQIDVKTKYKSTPKPNTSQSQNQIQVKAKTRCKSMLTPSAKQRQDQVRNNPLKSKPNQYQDQSQFNAKNKVKN